MGIKDVLKGCPLFFDLYDEEIEKITKNQSVLHYEKDELIISEGQEGEEIFILLEGIAELEKNTQKGSIKVEKIKQGEVFGLLIMLDSKTYGIDLRALTKVTVLELKHKELMALFEKNPRIFGIIAMNISRIMAKRLKSFQVRLGEVKAEMAKLKAQTGQ
jgi:CRP-like cAMP-binding protein